MAFSPTLGRWTQMDPSGYTDGLNPYESVLSNPITGLDPSGLETEVQWNGPSPKANPILINPGGIADKGYLRPGFHGWGGTQLPPDPGKVRWEHKDDDYEAPCVCVVVRTSTPRLPPVLRTRADYMTVQPADAAAVSEVLRLVPGRMSRFHEIMNEFNQMAIDHEQQHVENYLNTFGEPIQSVGFGATCDAARKMAADIFEAQKNGLVDRYKREKDRIDNNGDRDRGHRLLNEMNDLFTRIAGA